MKFWGLFLFGLASLEASFIQPVAATHAVRIRDDTAGLTTTAPAQSASSHLSGAEPAAVSATGSTSSIASSGQGASSSSLSAAAATLSISSNSTATTASVIPTLTGLHDATGSNSTSSGVPLPIHPTITPAIGLAGVILLISGLVYGLAGIKIKWLYTFFSTAYLASLAVTVLIVYVMNPPASNALQGAFLVAVVITGCIFGGLALIFHEVALGLGCTLGGFCLSMWFLSLSDGGLIASKSGRIIFIIAFTATTTLLSVTKWTRNYGLIGCLPFSGATAAVLGIDCFSRAGLKEFWLYLWDLNDNMFPLNTRTYPITRGMRVESAGIVFLFILGVIAQLKLFKLLKMKREAKKRMQRLHEEDRDKEEGEVGRRLQENIKREQVRWESIYGNRFGTGTDVARSVDTIGKDKISIQEKRISGEEMEMSDLSSTRNPTASNSRRPSTKGVNGATVTITVAEVDKTTDEIQEIDFEGRPLQRLSRPGSAAYPSKRNSDVKGASLEDKRASTTSTIPIGSARNSVNVAVPPPPAVVPLPFKIPVGDDELREVDEAASGTRSPDPEARRSSYRVSRASSAMKRTSFGPSTPDTAPSQEDLIMPYTEDDRASSIAATMDVLEADEISLTGSLVGDSEEPMFVLDGSNGPQRSSSVRQAVPKISTDIYSITNTEQTNLAETASGARFDASESEDAITPEAAQWKRLSAALFVEAEQSGAKKLGETLTSNDGHKTPTAAPSRSPISNHGRGGLASETTDSHLVRSRKTPEIPQDYLSLKPSEGRTSGATTPDTKRSSLQGEKRLSLRERRQSLKSTESGVKSIDSHPITQISLLALPKSTSKVVLSYRTNEWAKHLANAEAPDPEELQEPSSPGIAVDINYAQEKEKQVSPVDPTRIVGGQEPTNSYAGAHQVTPSEQPPLLASSPAVQPRPDGISRANSQGTVQAVEPSSTPPKRRDSANVSRASSVQRPHLPSSSRNYSTPVLGQTLVEVPSEAVSRATTKPISPSPNDTLLDKRTTMLKQRVSTVGLNGNGSVSTPNVSSASPIHPSDSASIRNGVIPEEGGDSDNVSLAERKLQLDNRRPHVRPVSSAANQGGRHSSAGWASPTNQLASFNSHQPKRDTSSADAAKRESLLQAWRASLRDDAGLARALGSAASPVADEGRRQAMIHERRREMLALHQNAQAQQFRDATFDTMMRRGDMQDLHREAMRRMQAGAKTEG